MQKDAVLQMQGIVKAYAGVLALNKMDLDVKRGEVHALLGENGAGKSTLIKILSGAIEPNSGKIIFDNKEYTRLTPIKSKEIGIGTIYQELNGIGYLNVAENIFLGNEPRSFGQFIDKRKMYAQTQELLDSLEIENIYPETQLKHLTVGYQQIVEIAKAVSTDIKLLIMDEPTASLSKAEVKQLFKLIARLKERGVSIIYISHRLEELYTVADRVTVLRDGMYIDTLDMNSVTKNKLISLMVGRELTENYPEPCFDVKEEDVVLKVKNINNKNVRDISFELRRGEILGFAGLVGAGRTETVRTIFGADDIDSGEIFIEGKKVIIDSPWTAIKNGIGFIPEDRKEQGVLLSMSVKDNVTLAMIKQLTTNRIINERRVKAVLNEFVNKLRIKTHSIEQRVKFLSGGNQQKVVLAKWLAAKSKILIFDEPTRGVDVGAKQEIYQLMRELTREGVSIIMISSEMPEIIGMSDRMIIMQGGRIKSLLDKNEFSQNKIMEIAASSVQSKSA